MKVEEDDPEDDPESWPMEVEEDDNPEQWKWKKTIQKTIQTPGQ